MMVEGFLYKFSPNNFGGVLSIDTDCFFCRAGTLLCWERRLLKWDRNKRRSFIFFVFDVQRLLVFFFLSFGLIKPLRIGWIIDFQQRDLSHARPVPEGHGSSLLSLYQEHQIGMGHQRSVIRSRWTSCAIDRSYFPREAYGSRQSPRENEESPKY